MSTQFLYSEFDVKYIDDGSEYTLNLTADIKLDKKNRFKLYVIYRKLTLDINTPVVDNLKRVLKGKSWNLQELNWHISMGF